MDAHEALGLVGVMILQGGEDGWFTDERMCQIIRDIKEKYPDCAVTLSLGERTRESYARLREAGADRYLLRHETADADHYGRLHPPTLTLKNRMECLATLKELGYQVDYLDVDRDGIVELNQLEQILRDSERNFSKEKKVSGLRGNRASPKRRGLGSHAFCAY